MRKHPQGGAASGATAGRPSRRTLGVFRSLVSMKLLVWLQYSPGWAEAGRRQGGGRCWADGRGGVATWRLAVQSHALPPPPMGGDPGGRLSPGVGLAMAGAGLRGM